MKRKAKKIDIEMVMMKARAKFDRTVKVRPVPRFTKGCRVSTVFPEWVSRTRATSD